MCSVVATFSFLFLLHCRHITLSSLEISAAFYFLFAW
uniref:Uncharacterized protein n=1 Tax=Rhizophora mucronata TaxID=61149 RepID=A0A2P2N0L8_RHIMU